MKMRPTIILLAAVLVSLATPARSIPPDNPNPYAPLPYKPVGNYGQAIVDMEMLKHPEVKLLTLHITPLGVPADSDKDRMMLCSSCGRIGNPDSDHDIGIFNSGKELVEWEKEPKATQKPWFPQAAPKYGVVEHIRTKSGDSVGLAAIVFPWKEGDDIAAYRKIAYEIMTDIKERIETKDDLLKPAP